ncbi:MAG: cupin domain-containing protein [Succinivibrionaceae bacterium]|nr:cupin domain-containing protein [Succinivibrionaceae bacterium]
MSNYSKFSVGNDGRTELHDKLNLTGAEISFNTLPKGVSVPFVHSHKQNEEIYIVLEGKGKVVIDDETIELKKGDTLRVSPKAKRQFSADSNEAISFICIQVKEGSLTEYTANDAIVY